MRMLAAAASPSGFAANAMKCRSVYTSCRHSLGVTTRSNPEGLTTPARCVKPTG